MTTVLVVIHVFACLFLIAVVLLQRGRGAEIGAVFGGGASSTVFGSRGAGNFLTRLTTGAAVVFMMTSLGLSYLMTSSTNDRLFDEPLDPADSPPAAEAPLFEEIGTAPADAGAAEAPLLGEPPAGTE